MRFSLPPLVLAAVLTLAACQQSHDTTAAATATPAATGNDTAPADEANAEPNSAASPDTLTTAVGAVATEQAADDATFAMKAAQGHMLEIETGKLAQSRGTEAMVKEMGGMLVNDHSKALDDLKGLAARKDMKLPTGLSAEGQKLRDRLDHLSGQAFDAAYLQAMAEDHQKDIKVFEQEAAKGKDADLRAYANRVLPTIREHAEMFAKHQKMQ